jgi:hypothetical protein
MGNYPICVAYIAVGLYCLLNECQLRVAEV